MDMEHIDKATALTGKVSVTSGSGTLILGTLSISDLGIIVGAVTTIITCSAYVYFKIKHYQLDKDLKHHQIAKLKAEAGQG